MFTGIVEELGRVARVERRDAAAALEVRCERVTEGTRVGDSISVAGCCLTVTRLPGDGFVADLMGETLDRTALGDLRPDDPVNLERALPAGGRLGGHVVQGHVDGVAEVVRVEPQRDWTTVTFHLPGPLTRYVAEKGSIAVDGVSLTVTGVEGALFGVGLIPHTLSATTLGTLQPGTRVNVEVDVLAKYVERLMTPEVPPSDRGTGEETT